MSVQDLGISLDTVWMLLAAMLVFFMQPGFALCGSVLFWFVGFGFMFGSDGAGFIGMPNFGDLTFYKGDLPVEGFLMFETVFCATSATIVSGAMAERTKFSMYCIYSFFISLIIYPVEGHWTWGGGWLCNADAGSFMMNTFGAAFSRCIHPLVRMVRIQPWFSARCFWRSKPRSHQPRVPDNQPRSRLRWSWNHVHLLDQVWQAFILTDSERYLGRFGSHHCRLRLG